MSKLRINFKIKLKKFYYVFKGCGFFNTLFRVAANSWGVLWILIYGNMSHSLHVDIAICHTLCMCHNLTKLTRGVKTQGIIRKVRKAVNAWEVTSWLWPHSPDNLLTSHIAELCNWATWQFNWMSFRTGASMASFVTRFLHFMYSWKGLKDLCIRMFSF